MVGIGMDYMIGLFKIFQNDVGPHWHMPNNCDMVMDHATCEHRLEGWMNIQLIISYDRGLSWVLNSFISFVKFGRRIQLPSGNQTWQREIFHLLYVYIYFQLKPQFGGYSRRFATATARTASLGSHSRGIEYRGDTVFFAWCGSWDGWFANFPSVSGQSKKKN
jgi:hypothetical protein